MGRIRFIFVLCDAILLNIILLRYTSLYNDFAILQYLKLSLCKYIYDMSNSALIIESLLE